MPVAGYARRQPSEWGGVAAVKPKGRHRHFVGASYRAQSIGGFAFGLLALGAAGALLAAGGPPPIAAIWGAGGGLALLGGVWAARQAKGRRLMEQALGVDRDTSVPLPARRAPGTAPPALTVETVAARKLPKPKARLNKVTESANVIGRPPLRILHLWVFENAARLQTYLGGGWREFGSVHLLRQATSVSRGEYAEARASGRLADLYIEDLEELRDAMARFDYRPQPKRFKRLRGFGPGSTTAFDRHGGYPVNSLLCHTSVWQEAFHALLGHVDVVTMDLAGYTQENAGTRFEIRELMDTFPLSHVVWLADPWSDTDFLEGQLRATWAGLAAGSPNRTDSAARARIVVTDRISRDNDDGPNSDKLLPDRRDARRIVVNLLTA